MAYDGIEVEIKLRASEQVAKAVREKLLQVKSTQIHHVDTYFDNPLKSFVKAIPVKEWLSIRNRGKKVIINHKYWHFDNDGKGTHSDEVELLVSNADEATRLMRALGFQPLITVNKHRTEGMIDTMLISVDEVEKLGYFILLRLKQRKVQVRLKKRKTL